MISLRHMLPHLSAASRVTPLGRSNGPPVTAHCARITVYGCLFTVCLPVGRV